jgi:hypothetical protein
MAQKHYVIEQAYMETQKKMSSKDHLNSKIAEFRVQTQKFNFMTSYSLYGYWNSSKYYQLVINTVINLHKLCREIIKCSFECCLKLQ